MNLITKYSLFAIGSDPQPPKRQFRHQHRKLSEQLLQLSTTVAPFSVLVSILQTHCTLSLKFNLLSRNVPYKIHSLGQRLLLSRFVNRLNAHLPIGCVKINPTTATISYEAAFYYASTAPTPAAVDELVIQHFAIFSHHFSRLESVLNSLSSDNKTNTHLSNFNSCLRVQSHCRTVRELQTPSRMTSAREPISIEVQVARKALPRYLGYLAQPLVESSATNEKSCVVSEIALSDKGRWMLIGQSLMNWIKAASVVFSYKLSPKEEDSGVRQETFKRMMVMKIAKQEFQHKISHQKRILQQIREERCANLSKFYECVNIPQYRSAVFIDFYKYSSLDSFLKNTRLYTTLTTKIHLLCSACLDLLFLHSKGILHLDVKPQNLLIGLFLVLRVNDLGEAYHPSVCAQDYRPGHTPLYSSPEVMSQSDPIGDKSDVYSLGVTIFETVFEEQPLRMGGTSPGGTVPNEICTERLIEKGPRSAMQLLLELSTRCMRPVPSERPHLQWCLVMLRECLAYLQGSF